MKKKRMALILPGLGYHSDKPLLYYAKKLFRQRGYQIEEITYQNCNTAGRKSFCAD